MISAARRRVVIFTPYFIPPRELSGALVARRAARRAGWTSILPAQNNLFYVHHASRRYQGPLARMGVRIWYQPPPFAHTKLLLVDDWYALMGVRPISIRAVSFSILNSMSRWPIRLFRRKLSDYADEVLSRSRRMRYEDYDRAALPSKLFDSLCWLLSPYI